MEIIPAIDISNGKCVRLYKGQKGTEKVYYDDPLEALEFWISQGAPRIHIVDLDGAWGLDTNKKLLSRLIEKAIGNVKIQIGGGIRTVESAIEIINRGVDRIIIGTLAVKNPQSITELADVVGSDRTMVAIDYRNERIAVKGWVEKTVHDPFSFGRRVSELGAGSIIFSSIEADGTFEGPDIDNIGKMLSEVKDVPIYAAGGIRNLKDLENLKQIGVAGVIIGKAFYEEKIPYSTVIDSENYH